MSDPGSVADVLVIGGGVIGCACAWRLAQAGLRVTIVERGECGREASWAASGIIETGSAARTDPLALLRRASVARYPAFIAELRERTGIDPQYIPCGSLDLITDDSQDAAADREVAAADGQMTLCGQPAVERLTQHQARTLEPALTADIRGALLKRESAQIRSPRLLAALRAACELAGVRIVEHTPVLDLLLEKGDGPLFAGVADKAECPLFRVGGAVTHSGPLHARTIILAAGSWSSHISQRLSGLIDIHPVRGQIVLLEQRPPPLRHIVEVGSRYLICRPDGLTLVGSTLEHDAGFDKRNTAAAVGGLLEFGQRIVPSLKSAAVVRTWAGLRPAARDNRPYIGPVPGFEGLIAATGHFRSGLVLAPITAEVVTQIVLARPTPLDLTWFTPGPRRSATKTDTSCMFPDNATPPPS